MKIYISVDMEGITGVAVQSQVLETHALYKRACEFMVGDVNAAIEGALEAGAQEVLVNDGHNHMMNLDLVALNPAALLISGENKPLLQMEGVKDCDIAFFIGYHSKGGSPQATLDHTYWSSLVSEIVVNDAAIGEAEFNALLAGEFDVPVVLLSGDEATCASARSFIGEWLETAAVKRSIGRESSVCLHPTLTTQLIRDAAKKAVMARSAARPCKAVLPITLDIEFFKSSMADQATVFPDARRLDARSVRIEADSVERAYRLMLTLFALARNSL
ncbi:M55 family metallopeptidase [Candidatus Bipolaricaulota bacterium]